MIVLTVARKEIADGIRNRWVIATTLLLAALAVSLVALGSAPGGRTAATEVAVSVVSLSSLTMYLMPLLGLMLAYDAVVGEVERGTMLLLLAYPVRRAEVVIGKFLGHLALVAAATGIGYGCGAVALLAGGAAPGSWGAYAGMVASSVLLGAVFLALGYLVSTMVRERATALGIAVALWVGLVLIYDLALLAALAADPPAFLAREVVPYLLLANPVDAYRLLNLVGFEQVAASAGLAGMGSHAGLTPSALLGALVAWVALPLLATAWLFKRKEL